MGGMGKQGGEGGGQEARSFMGQKGVGRTVRPLTFSACLTKGKRPQYLRVVSTHGVHSKDLVGPHKSYEAEPLHDFPFFLCFFFFFFFTRPHSFRRANVLNIVSEEYEKVYVKRFRNNKIQGTHGSPILAIIQKS